MRVAKNSSGAPLTLKSSEIVSVIMKSRHLKKTRERESKNPFPERIVPV